MTRVRLTRSMLDRVLGGVCGGIGSYLGLSGWWVRIAFVALTVTNLALGIFLYLFLWLVIPGQKLGELPPILRPGQPPTPRYARPEAMLLLGMGTVAVGALLLAQNTGVLQGLQGNLLAPAMLLVIGLVLLLKHVRGAS